MMEELNKKISDLEERIAKEESDKLIIIREEKEARNAAENVCKEKSAELERIQDKKSAAERMGEVFCQEAIMQTWRHPFSSDNGDNVDVVVPPLAESIADGTRAKFLKRPGDRVAVGELIAQIETDKVAMTHPMAITNYNIDMESLISDQNRSIATLAITILLKTGNE
ncbi:hypothetical protein S245_020581 [Arachis hypogaea]